MPEEHDESEQDAPVGNRAVRHYHDQLFRQQMGAGPAELVSVFRSIISPTLTDWLALDTAEVVDGTFVDDELNESRCDVLLRTRRGGREQFIYVLTEHQRKSDPLMPYRIHRYLGRIWERYLSENPGTKQLPVVVPVVIHQGESRWSAPIELRDMLGPVDDVPAEVEEFLSRQRFFLVDLTQVDTAQLRTWSLTVPARLTLVLLKIAPGNPGMAKDLWEWADDLQELATRHDGMERLGGMLKYSLEASKAPPDTLQPIVARLGREAEEELMTAAYDLRAEGRVEGRVEGEAIMLVRLLTRRFGNLPVSAQERIERASTDQLEIWADRLLNANTLDEVLG